MNDGLLKELAKKRREEQNRADELEKYCEENGITVRAVAKRYGIKTRILLQAVREGTISLKNAMDVADTIDEDNDRNATIKEDASLCWDCTASGRERCIWDESHGTIPVPGWEAEERWVRVEGPHSKLVRSYNVRACPLYEPERLTSRPLSYRRGTVPEPPKPEPDADGKGATLTLPADYEPFSDDTVWISYDEWKKGPMQ